MIKKALHLNQGKDDPDALTSFFDEIHTIAQGLATARDARIHTDNEAPVSLPSNESIIQLIHQARRILFPDFFFQTAPATANLAHCLAREIMELYDNLSTQVGLSLRHNHLQAAQPDHGSNKRGSETAIDFLRALFEIKRLLTADMCAAMEGDPAARSLDEVICSYPGFSAITVYRLAHKLHELRVPLIPRIMTEYAHSLTGIDIHPGAEIGESFFIDHGTGVVVGETTEIGNRVRLYQGVTLGALSLSKHEIGLFKNKKRHPTIEDDVIIYSNATILGAEAVIGARSIIGGNIWITERVPADTKVLLEKPKLIFIGNNGHKTSPTQEAEK
jgi:serine O-acetyltransferase